MGRVCAWCEALLHGAGMSSHRISHTICAGCLEQLQSTLAGSGLRLSDGSSTPPASR